MPRKAVTLIRVSDSEWVARVGRPRSNPETCTFDGCGEECTAKGLCARHYAQDRRGVLGKTRAKAAPGEAAVVKAFVGAELKGKIEKRAKRDRVSVSELCAGILAKALE